MKTNQAHIALALLVVSALLGSCSQLSSIGGNDQAEAIEASGVIEAQQINLAPEIAGRIASVHVEEGSRVEKGDLLLELEDELVLAQLRQADANHQNALAQLESARAAEAAADASLETSRAVLEAAEIAYQLTLTSVIEAEGDSRIADWNQSTPNLYDLPAWYFEQAESIAAGESLVASYWDAYQSELERYQETAAEIGDGDFRSAERRLSEALAAFWIAEDLLDRPVGFREQGEITDLVDSIYDAAESELEAAQKDFDQLLTDPEYDEIIEARAKVTVAREHYELARDYLSSQYTGEYSREVLAAETEVTLAEAGVKAAEAQVAAASNNRRSAESGVESATAELDLINLELEKLSITSPISGVVLTRSVEPGEVISAGYTALTIGNLDQLSVTVYLPEDRYGQVALGDQAELTIDSYPDQAFQAEVTWIADQAEYTPRNVQTQEERQNTVYAVRLSIQPSSMLKPGMPADVVFNP